MISNNAIKTEKPNINFYYEDIINYLINKMQYLNSQKIQKNLQANHTKRRQTLY